MVWSHTTESFSSKTNCVSPLRGKKIATPRFCFQYCISTILKLKCFPYFNLSFTEYILSSMRYLSLTIFVVLLIIKYRTKGIWFGEIGWQSPFYSFSTRASFAKEFVLYAVGGREGFEWRRNTTKFCFPQLLCLRRMRVKAGILLNWTGISSPVEEPGDPELVLWEQKEDPRVKAQVFPWSRNYPQRRAVGFLPSDHRT